MSDASEATTRIWVDADACPVPLREMLIRAALRARVEVIFVANQWIRVPASPLLRSIQVAGGTDVADAEIASRVAPGDLVVTQDIPLAAQVIERGATALGPRGEQHSAETIAGRLSMRNFMDELRGAGVPTGGPPPFHARDRQAFANALDGWLARR